MLGEEAIDRLIDNAIAGKPDAAPDDPAREIIAGLARLNSLRPRAKSKIEARRLMLVRAREIDQPPAKSRWRQKLTAVMAAASALTMLSGGTVFAASGSAPGDLFYPVKRAAENVGLAFRPPGIARAQAELALARARLAEIKILIKRRDQARIGALVREMNGNLTAAGGWRSRLSDAEERQVEAGTAGLRRAVKGTLRATPWPAGSKPAAKPLPPKPAPRVIRREPAAAPSISPERPQQQLKPKSPAPPLTRQHRPERRLPKQQLPKTR